MVSAHPELSGCVDFAKCGFVKNKLTVAFFDSSGLDEVGCIRAVTVIFLCLYFTLPYSARSSHQKATVRLFLTKPNSAKFMHPENSECADTMSFRAWLRPSMLGLGFAPQMGLASNSRLEVAAECCGNHCNSFWHKRCH